MKPQTYIHFTEDISRFEDGGFLNEDEVPPESPDQGIFVYKYSDSFPLEKMKAAWGWRDEVFIEGVNKEAEEHIELFQKNDDESTRDDYFIPKEHFKKFRVFHF